MPWGRVHRLFHLKKSRWRCLLHSVWKVLWTRLLCILFSLQQGGSDFFFATTASVREMIWMCVCAYIKQRNIRSLLLLWEYVVLTLLYWFSLWHPEYWFHGCPWLCITLVTSRCKCCVHFACWLLQILYTNLSYALWFNICFLSNCSFVRTAALLPVGGRWLNHCTTGIYVCATTSPSLNDWNGPLVCWTKFSFFKRILQ